MLFADMFVRSEHELLSDEDLELSGNRAVDDEVRRGRHHDQKMGNRFEAEDPRGRNPVVLLHQTDVGSIHINDGLKQIVSVLMFYLNSEVY